MSETEIAHNEHTQHSANGKRCDGVTDKRAGEEVKPERESGRNRKQLQKLTPAKEYPPEKGADSSSW